MIRFPGWAARERESRQTGVPESVLLRATLLKISRSGLTLGNENAGMFSERVNREWFRQHPREAPDISL